MNANLPIVSTPVVTSRAAASTATAETATPRNSADADDAPAGFGVALERLIRAHAGGDANAGATTSATAVIDDKTGSKTDTPSSDMSAIAQAIAALGLADKPATPGSSAAPINGAMQGTVSADAQRIGVRNARPGTTDGAVELPVALASAAGKTSSGSSAATANIAGLLEQAIAAAASTGKRAGEHGTDTPSATDPALTALTAASTNTSTSQTNDTTPVAQHAIDARFGTSAWSADVTDKVRHFVLEKIEVADLRMNPQELGPIRVQIALDQSTAAIHFSASRDDVRDALAQNINNLRDALAQAGVSLQNASTGSFGEGQAFAFMQQQARNTRSGRTSNEDDVVASTSATTAASRTGANRTARASGVDLFA